MSSVLWRRTDGTGMDRASITDTPDGHRIAGTAIFSLDSEPYEIRYTVMTDMQWHTTTVGAHAQLPDADRRLSLSADGKGSWFVSDEPLLDLYGAVDVDLGWTPATNTLAIKRLKLDVGQDAAITVARIDFPKHDITRVTQRYTRIDASTYRYESGDFSVDLAVDDRDVVTTYPDGWELVATG